jgi:hypothetical protein
VFDSLSVQLMPCTTDDGVAELVRAAGSSLTHLSLGGPFSPLSGGAASAIGAHCAAPLSALALPCCRLDVSGLAALSRIGSSLTQLDLSGCAALSEEALAQLLKRTGPGCGARLRVLCLRQCDAAVTDDLLAAFLPRAHGLRTLDVAHCYALTDISARLLGHAATRGALRALTELDLTGCHRISRRARDRLRDAPNVRVAPALVVRVDPDSDDDDEGTPRSLERLTLR